MGRRPLYSGGEKDQPKNLNQDRNWALEQRQIRQDATKYLKAQSFLVDLRKKYLHRRITGQQYSRLRHDALTGNTDAAREKLEQILFGEGGKT